jgi:hypothetical protein
MVHTPINDWGIGDLVQITARWKNTMPDRNRFGKFNNDHRTKSRIPPVWPVSVGDLSSDNAEMWESTSWHPKSKRDRCSSSRFDLHGIRYQQLHRNIQKALSHW